MGWLLMRPPLMLSVTWLYEPGWLELPRTLELGAQGRRGSGHSAVAGLAWHQGLPQPTSAPLRSPSTH